MNESVKYTAADIERYHSGALSAAEMHALEAAALDDPFLADALEGYQHTQTAPADLAGLQQRLAERIEKEKKHRGVFFMQNNWLRVAALFLLIAGGGWLVSRLFTDGQPEMATTAAKKEAPAEAVQQRPDSAANVSSDAPLTAAAPKKDGQKEEEYKTAQTAKPATAAPPALETNEPAPGIAALSKPAADTILQNQEIVARQATETERKKEQLVAAATAPSVGAYDKRLADVSGRVDTIKNFNVMLKRDTTGLSEVVVVGYGKQKARKSNRNGNLKVDTLEPAEGWTNFDDYIAGNLKEPEEIKVKGVKGGEVELSFEVNKEGEPVNIAVTKSLCDRCDAEAVRLLKEGPKWKKNKKKGKVKIKFPQ